MHATLGRTCRRMDVHTPPYVPYCSQTAWVQTREVWVSCNHEVLTGHCGYLGSSFKVEVSMICKEDLLQKQEKLWFSCWLLFTS